MPTKDGTPFTTNGITGVFITPDRLKQLLEIEAGHNTVVRDQQKTINELKDLVSKKYDAVLVHDSRLRISTSIAGYDEYLVAKEGDGLIAELNRKASEAIDERRKTAKLFQEAERTILIQERTIAKLKQDRPATLFERLFGLK